MGNPEKTSPSQPQTKGWVSLNYYRDIERETNTGTAAVAFESTTPFSFFGFVDFSKSSYWMEDNLRYRLGRLPLHASLQYVAASGLASHLVRPGLSWALHQTKGLSEPLARGGVLALGVIFHLAEMNFNFDFRRGGQIEPFVAGVVPNTPLFYEGWLDLDIDFSPNENVKFTPVTDFLVGANLVGNPTTSGTLGAVAEIRYNKTFKNLREENPVLRQDPLLNPLGLELGLRYFLLF